MSATSKAQMIRDYVREHPGASTAEIGRALGLSSRAAGSYMRNDIRSGTLDMDLVQGERRYWYVREPGQHSQAGALERSLRAQLRAVAGQTTSELAFNSDRPASQVHVTLQAMQARGLVVARGARPVRWSLAPKA